MGSTSNPLFKTLTKDFIVSDLVAYELLKTYSEEQIRANLEYIKEHAKNNQIRNYGAFTVKAIKQNYQIQESPEEIAEKKKNEELRKKVSDEKLKEEERKRRAKIRIEGLLSSNWWKNVTDTLREEYGENYDRFLIDLKPFAIRKKNKDVVLSASSKFIRDWVRREFIEKSYLSNSKRTLKDIILSIKSEEFSFISELEEVTVVFIED